MPAEVWAAVKARNEIIAEILNVNLVGEWIQLPVVPASFVPVASRDGSRSVCVEIRRLNRPLANEFGDGCND